MIEYKGYTITPMNICFSIMYCVVGENLTCEYFEDVTSAKRKIDKTIALKFVDDSLDNIALKIEVDRDIIVECIRELVLND